MNNCAVILAAGEGKRMKSKHSKVLCEVLFKPMLGWVLDAAAAAGAADRCVVTGHGCSEVEGYLQSRGDGCETVRQGERLGTGHAVLQAEDFLSRHAGGSVLVLCGDAPLMDGESIRGAYEEHRKKGNAVTVISAVVKEPAGYGRILRTPQGGISGIVEEKNADEDQKAIREINSGGYWFSVDDLLSVLPALPKNPVTGEYYLTDTIELLLKKGKKAGAFAAASEDVVLGANDRVQLAALNDRARAAVLKEQMLKGVSIPCTDGVLIGPDVTIGQDTVILPGTILRGRVTVGEDCVIGPNTLLEDSTVGSRAKLNAVQCYQSAVHDGVTAGPFVHIRPNSELKAGVKVGDFVEIKNSVVGCGTKVPHLTYVGDSDVGEHVNFGCGCVTVNYDGKSKSRCAVGDHAFIGCNTNLIAPVRIGEYGYTAAGSTITDDVPENALAIARARQVVKPMWVTSKREKDEG